MPIPNILPPTLPKGTRLVVTSIIYEFTSIAVKQSIQTFLGPTTCYSGDVRNIVTGQIYIAYTAFVSTIEWGLIEKDLNIQNGISCEETKVFKKTCLWCNEEIGLNQNTPYCEVGNPHCKDYYFALKDRLKLDFREPSDALPYDKESVKRWVNKSLGIK